MKTLKRTQMQPIVAESLAEYAEKFNSIMNWISEHGKFLEYVNDLHLHEGYIVYEVTDYIPQNMEDILSLHGESIQCIQCRNYRPTSFKNGECDFCRGKLRNDDSPCHHFWDAWAEGECWLKEEEEKKYDKYKDELRCARIPSSQRSDAPYRRRSNGSE